MLIFLLMLGNSLPETVANIAGLFVLLSPGYILFIRTGTVANPHPGFSSGGLLLGLLVNVAAYSLLVFVMYSGWRHLRLNRINSDRHFV
jgi:hypothetical protein